MKNSISILLIYLTSLCAQAQPIPQRTVWLPFDGQEHEVGAASRSGDLNWITTWAGNNQTGILAKTSQVDVPAGDWVAIFQVYHKQSAGKSLAKLLVKSNRTIIKSVELTSATFDNFIDGGYQRGSIEFALSETTPNVTLELQDYNNHFIWVGAISLQRKQKPVYVIGHQCSTWNKVVNYVNDGANAAEFDITPESNPASDETAFSVFHGWPLPDIHFTAAKDFSAYLKNIKIYMDEGKLAMVIVDCKNPSSPSVETYASRLATNLKNHKFDLERTVVSVPKDHAKAFAAEMKKNGFPCHVDSYYESYPSQSDRDLSAIQDWVTTIRDAGATMVGVGKDHKVRGEFFRYAYWLTGLLKERDASNKFKKIYFWTANTAYIARQVLDYGVDGILTDEPKTITNVIKEAPYNQIFRMATAKDKVSTVHGAVNNKGIMLYHLNKNNALIHEKMHDSNWEWKIVNHSGNKILSTLPDGKVSLLTIDDNGNAVSYKENGPNWEWRPFKYADNKILFTLPNGKYALQTVDNGGNVIRWNEYGPTWEWRVVNHADNKILLNLANGQYALQTLDNGGNVIRWNEYGPTWEWRVVNYADNKILLNLPNGQYALQTLDNEGNIIRWNEYGPTWEWKVVSYSDNNILLKLSNGRYAIQTIDDLGNIVGWNEFGPFPGLVGFQFSK